MNMEGTAVCCVYDRKTKGCYLHVAYLILDFKLLRGGDDECSRHLSLTPNSLSNKQSW